MLFIFILSKHGIENILDFLPIGAYKGQFATLDVSAHLVKGGQREQGKGIFGGNNATSHNLR